MTVQLQVCKIEDHFFTRWLSDDVDTLPVVKVMIGPVGGHDNPTAACIVSSTVGIRCIDEKEKVTQNSICLPCEELQL